MARKSDTSEKKHESLVVVTDIEGILAGQLGKDRSPFITICT